MLSLSSLGFPTIHRFAPLGGFGEYTETKTSEGSCAGADYRCSARPEDGGIFSCRPCTTAVLEMFKALQNQINRLITVKKLSLPLLGVDGRIGPKTVAAFKAVSTGPGSNNIPPSVEDASRWMAKNAEVIQKELKVAADALKAPREISKTIVPGTVQTPALEPSAVPVKKKSRAGIIVGGLALVAAVGLVAAAAYSRKRS